MRIVLADLGDEAALAVEPAGFVVILRVDDAAETELAVHTAGDFLDAARRIGTAQQLRDNALAVGSVEVVFPRGVEAAVADRILGHADFSRIVLPDHAGDALEHLAALGIFHRAVRDRADVDRRIPAQSVDAVFVEPHADLIGDKLAHLRTSEIGPRSPRGRAAFFILVEIDTRFGVPGAVAVKLPEAEVFRPVVVVHDVEVHGDAALVGGFDELLERVGTTVGIFHGELVARVVSPTMPSVEFVDRHEEDAVDAHFLEMTQFGDGVAQRAGLPVRGIGIVEGAGMQLIHDHFADRAGGLGRSGVAPIEDFRIVNHAAFFAGRDQPRARILALEFAVDEVEVFVPGFGRSDFERPNSGGVLFPHRVATRLPVVERADDINRLGVRSPDAEGDAFDATAGSFLHDRAERLRIQASESRRRDDE